MANEQETETLNSLLEIMHEHDLDRIKVKVGDAVYELVHREAGAQIVAPASMAHAEAFVQECDRIENGAVICILEAMKLFNEIQSDHAGTIVRILPENGELVSQGDDLFWIAP